MGYTIDGVQIDKPKSISWYPDELAWQLNLSRTTIRKIPALQNLHQFLVDETESGNISRQELVSMIPPLLMDIKPYHKVLDMCAAPGSKTAQLIEMLHAEQSHGWPEGFVMANDSDNKRCYIMVHQAKRLNSPCFLIVNHDASLLPSLTLTNNAGQQYKLLFDRILCDVPCSGDGTLRKNYMIWKKWNLSSALNLHSLQYRILLRGVELLQTGGRLVYSTCSFNPIENEAVVAAILHKAQGSIELVDISMMLPGLKIEPGLSSWKVFADDNEIECADNMPEDDKRYRATMWPPTGSKNLSLHRCIRILPHHENSGGFFVAVLKKVTQLPWSKCAKTQQPQGTNWSQEEKGKEEDKCAEIEGTVNFPENKEAGTLKGKEYKETGNVKEGEEYKETGNVKEGEEYKPKAKKMKYTNVYKEDPFVFFKDDVDIWPQIRLFYGVKDDFPLTQLFTRCHIGKKRNVYMVNSAVRQIVETCEDKLKVINCGVKVWARSDAKGVTCDFRLTQDGIYSIYPYLTSRKVEIMKDDVRIILTEENPFNAKLCKETKSLIENMEQGSVIFVYDPKKYDQNSQDLLLYIVGWRGKTSVRSFVPKGDRFHILRLCDMLPADKMFFNDSSSSKNMSQTSEGQMPEEECSTKDDCVIDSQISIEEINEKDFSAKDDCVIDSQISKEEINEEDSSPKDDCVS